MATFTSKSEFELEKRVHLTNEYPPFDMYDALNSAMKNELWQWVLGYSRVKYNQPYCTIEGNSLVRDVDADNVYHKFVNGEESEVYGPIADVDAIATGGEIPTYHTMELDGVFLPEYDLFAHEIYRYLGSLYPDHPDYNKLLTQNEINDIFSSLGSMLNINTDPSIFDDTSNMLCSSAEDAQDEALMMKIRNIRNSVFRRKFYGSATGYRSFVNDLTFKASIFPVGTYLPYLDNTSTEIDTLGRTYRRKFRIIDWDSSTNKALEERKDYTTSKFVSVPFENEVVYTYPSSTYFKLQNVGEGDFFERDDTSIQIKNISSKVVEDGMYSKIDLISGVPSSFIDAYMFDISGFNYYGNLAPSAFIRTIELELNYSDESLLNKYKPVKYLFNLDTHKLVMDAKTTQQLYKNEISLNSNLCITTKKQPLTVISVKQFNRGTIKFNSDSYENNEIYSSRRNGQLYFQLGRDFNPSTLEYEDNFVELTIQGNDDKDVKLLGYLIVDAIKSGPFSVKTNALTFYIQDIYTEDGSFNSEESDYGNICTVTGEENFSLTSKVKSIVYTSNGISYELSSLVASINSIDIGTLDAYPIFINDELNEEYFMASFSLDNEKNTIYNYYDDPYENIQFTEVEFASELDKITNEYVIYNNKLYKINDNNVYSEYSGDKYVSILGRKYHYVNKSLQVVDTSVIKKYISKFDLNVQLESEYIQKAEFIINGSITAIGSIEPINESTSTLRITNISENVDSISSVVYNNQNLTINSVDILRKELPTIDFSFEKKVLTEGSSEYTVSYMSYFTNKACYCNIDVDKSNNTLYFTTPDALEFLSTLSIGDIVFGAPTESNKDVFITGISSNSVTINSILTNSGDILIHFLVRTDIKPEEISDTFLYKRSLLENTRNVFNTGCYGGSDWPNTSNAYLEGVSDKASFKIVNTPQNENNKIYNIHNLKPFDYVCNKLNVSRPALIKFENDLFIELQANKILTMSTKRGTPECLMNVKYLDYIQNNLTALSRASDTPNVGVNLILNTDTSGLYKPGSVDRGAYTDASIKAFFRVVPNYWEADYMTEIPEYSVPYYAQIGTGSNGDSKLQQYTSSSFNEDNVYNLSVFSNDKGGHNLYTDSLDSGEIIVKGAEITSIEEPLFEVTLGEYDTQIAYKPDDSKYRFTTVSSSFYKETFKNVLNIFSGETGLHYRDYDDTYDFIENGEFNRKEDELTNAFDYKIIDIESLAGKFVVRDNYGNNVEYSSLYGGKLEGSIIDTTTHSALLSIQKAVYYTVTQNETSNTQLLADTLRDNIFNVSSVDDNGTISDTLSNYMLYFINCASSSGGIGYEPNDIIGVIYINNDFKVIKLNRRSIFTRILPFNKVFTHSSVSLILNGRFTPPYAGLKDNISSFKLPRRFLAEGSYKFNIRPNPRFRSQGYLYNDDNTKITNTEVTLDITKDKITYDSDNNAFYVNTNILEGSNWSENTRKCAIKFNEIKYWKNILEAYVPYKKSESLRTGINKTLSSFEDFSVSKLTSGDKLLKYKEVYKRYSPGKINKVTGFNKVSSINIPALGMSEENDIIYAAEKYPESIHNELSNMMPYTDAGITPISANASTGVTFSDSSTLPGIIQTLDDASITSPVLSRDTEVLDFKYFKRNYFLQGVWNGESVTVEDTSMVSVGDSIRSMYLPTGEVSNITDYEVPSMKALCKTDTYDFYIDNSGSIHASTNIIDPDAGKPRPTSGNVFSDLVVTKRIFDNDDEETSVWSLNTSTQNISEVSVNTTTNRVETATTYSDVFSDSTLGYVTINKEGYSLYQVPAWSYIDTSTNEAVLEFSLDDEESDYVTLPLKAKAILIEDTTIILRSGEVCELVYDVDNGYSIDVESLTSFNEDIYTVHGLNYETDSTDYKSLLKATSAVKIGENYFISAYLPRYEDLLAHGISVDELSEGHDGMFNTTDPHSDTPILIRYGDDGYTKVNIRASATGRISSVLEARGYIYFKVAESNFFVIKGLTSLTPQSIGTFPGSPLTDILLNGFKDGFIYVSDSDGAKYYTAKGFTTLIKVPPLGTKQLGSESNPISFTIFEVNTTENTVSFSPDTSLNTDDLVNGALIIMSILSTSKYVDDTAFNEDTMSEYNLAKYSEVTMREIADYIDISVSSYPVNSSEYTSLYAEYDSDPDADVGTLQNSFGQNIYVTYIDNGEREFTESIAFTPKYTINELKSVYLPVTSEHTVEIATVDWDSNILTLDFTGDVDDELMSQDWGSLANIQKYLTQVCGIKFFNDTINLDASGTTVISSSVPGITWPSGLVGVTYTIVVSGDTYKLKITKDDTTIVLFADDVYVSLSYLTSWANKNTTSNIVTDLKNSSNQFSGMYFPPKAYGSLLNNNITDGNKPWEIDTEAFEDSDLAGTYLCDENGNMVLEDGVPVLIKTPKYSTYEDLFQYEGSFFEDNSPLTEVNDDSIYINSVSPNKAELVTNSAFDDDFSDGETHYIKAYFLTKKSVGISDTNEIVEIAVDDFNKWTPDRVFIPDDSYPKAPISFNGVNYNEANKEFYNLEHFKNANSEYIYVCDSTGKLVRYTNDVPVADGYGDPIATSGGSNLYIEPCTATNAVSMNTPLYTSCKDWFKHEYYIEGENANPFWQEIYIYPEYNNGWSQHFNICEYKNLNSSISLSPIADNRYFNISKCTDYTEVGNAADVYYERNYIDTKNGSVQFNLEKPDESYKELDFIKKFGLTATNSFNQDSGEYKDVWGEDADAIHFDFVMTSDYSLNTSEDYADPHNKDAAIVEITEFGLFNSKHQLIAYAHFPPIEYRSDSQHLSITSIVTELNTRD